MVTRFTKAEAKKISNKLYREANKERISLSKKAWYQKNKARVNKKTSKRIENNYETNMLVRARCRAKSKNLDFNLTLEDVVIPSHCKYLGKPLTTIRGKGVMNYNASLDRIDSTKGYIKGNVQVISYLANRMKQDANQEDLIAFAKGVLNG